MFVYTDNGYVNLAHVTSVRNRKGGKTCLFGADGGLLAETQTSSHEISEINTPVVAAAQGEFAYNVSIYDGTPEVTQKRIVAWKIYPSDTMDPTPVFSDGICNNDTILLPLPDGRVYSGDSWYASLSEAVADILADHLGSDLLPALLHGAA